MSANRRPAINPFTAAQNYIKGFRNMASASSQYLKTPGPVYSNWTIKKAVEDGYKANPWVYRSVFLKCKAAGSIPWLVMNENGEPVENHHLTTLLNAPNPFVSKQDVMELVVSWLDLAGNSYLKKVKGLNGFTEELWPVSPDRLTPVATSSLEKWMEGYALDKSKKVSFQPDEIVHHKYFNPADPLLGIGPLQAVAKTVDISNGQKDFNRSTTTNRGVVDGIFTFEKEFKDQAQTDAVAEKLNERHRGKRMFGVLGSNAKYIRTALTPAEMDFIQSDKANREEIFIAFGVPPVYAGVMDGATLNNYKTSELVFWFGTMLFLLDDLKDTFNFSFRDELKPGEKICYDLTAVPAIRAALLDKTKTAGELFKMGVPFDQLNRVFEFGFDEFDGWDESHVGTQAGETITTESGTRKNPFTFIEKREATTQDQIDIAAIDKIEVFADALRTQQEAVFDAMDNGLENVDPEAIIKGQRQIMTYAVGSTYVNVAVEFGSSMVIESRAAVDPLEEAINTYLLNEATVLTQVSLIDATTVGKIMEHIRTALETGQSANECQQALVDSGIFNDRRALMLSRTITGNAANLGQQKGAELGGAKSKTWSTAGFEVRKSHRKLDNVTIPIDDYFTVGKEKALYP